MLARGRAAARFCLPPLLLLLPWLAMNATTVGNPVAPILSSSIEVEGLAGGGELAFTRDLKINDTTEMCNAITIHFGDEHTVTTGLHWR